jgi:hypothetical protein
MFAPFLALPVTQQEVTQQTFGALIFNILIYE